MASKVFLITGTSTGFGAELVKVVLEKGDIAVATARDPSQLSFTGTTEKNYLALKLDVTDKQSIEAAFDKAIAKFGRVDVVVNNAGYGLTGIFESLSEANIRRQMDVNFFGLLDVTRKALEVMRGQEGGGVIQQITSIGGQIGFPAYSLYSASKFAVEGFTESVAAEVKPEWNIRLQIVEPGPFRTDWAGRSLTITENHPAYDHIDVKARANARDKTQPGDPYKAALAMWELTKMPNPPFRVVLGLEAFEQINEKIESLREEIAKYEDFAKACDFSDIAE